MLVATDVAARGIDIVDLGHVVNYDVPMVPEDYVHRVGRTARAEQTGDAITFVSHEEERLFRDIEKAVGRRIDRSQVPILPERAPATVAPEQQRRFAPPRSTGGFTGKRSFNGGARSGNRRGR